MDEGNWHERRAENFDIRNYTLDFPRNNSSTISDVNQSLSSHLRLEHGENLWNLPCEDSLKALPIFLVDAIMGLPCWSKDDKSNNCIIWRVLDASKLILTWWESGGFHLTCIILFYFSFSASLFLIPVPNQQTSPPSLLLPISPPTITISSPPFHLPSSFLDFLHFSHHFLSKF